MATFTTKLGLRKPATTDFVNVTTDISDSMDIIDNAIGFHRQASFPGSPYTGRALLRSDLSDNAFVYNGTVWMPNKQIAVFASTAARDAGFPTPVSGDQAIVTANKSMYIYNGAAWTQFLVYEGVPQAILFRATNQTIANATDDYIAFTSEGLDTLGGHDNAVNNTRYTAQAGGQYLCIATVPWNNNATGIRRVDFRVNGTTFMVGGAYAPGAATESANNVSRIIPLSFGDYVEVQVHQTSGGNLDINGGFGQGASLDIIWIGYKA